MKPAMVWQVQDGEGERVGAIVELMRAIGAPRDGRVFLNGRPAQLDEPVDPGDRVEIWPRRSPQGEQGAKVLVQRDGVVLVSKPAALPSDTTQLGQDSVQSAMLAHFKGGRVHLVSRLDVGVSGVMACTLGKDANRRIEHWRQTEVLEKRYLAIAQGRLTGSGEWTWPLGRVRDRGGRHRASPEAKGAKPAVTRFEALGHAPDATLLLLTPVTGRMHQLRAHAQRAGHPFYGDRRYGGPSTVTADDGAVHSLDRIALHSWRLSMPHIEAEVPLPDALVELWVALGGGVDALERLPDRQAAR